MPARERLDFTNVDIILRSVEGQEFPAHKFMLSLVSPVFRDMFTLPQPPKTPPVPVVDVCETGEVLDLFLRCIYPVPKPDINKIEGIELLEALVIAADKYDAKVVLEAVERSLVAPQNLKEDPLRAYAVSRASPALHGLADAAAQCMTFRTITGADPCTIERLTTTDLHRLVMYLDVRENDAKINVEDPDWVISYNPLHNPLHNPLCSCSDEVRLEMKEEIKKALMDAFVADPSLSEETAVALACRQLSKVRACDLHQKCSLVTRGEWYAKSLRKKLREMSADLWDEVWRF